MSIPIKHHYVPQCYLKFFAKCINNKNIVIVYDKKKDTFFKSNIKDIAQEKNYNKVTIEEFIIPPPNNDELFYEKKYVSLIEGRLPKIIRNIIASCTMSNGNIVLNKTLKKTSLR